MRSRFTIDAHTNDKLDHPLYDATPSFLSVLCPSSGYLLSGSLRGVRCFRCYWPLGFPKEEAKRRLGKVKTCDGRSSPAVGLSSRSCMAHWESCYLNKHASLGSHVDHSQSTPQSDQSQWTAPMGISGTKRLVPQESDSQNVLPFATSPVYSWMSLCFLC